MSTPDPVTRPGVVHDRLEVLHLPGPRSAAVRGGPTGAEHPWSVRRELGRGAGSVVHLAVREDLGEREYALKRRRPAPRRAGEQAAAERLLRREAALLAGVDHPGLTRVHAVERVEGRLAIVMDAHDGTTLADLLSCPAEPRSRAAGRRREDGARGGPLSVTTTVRLALDVCDALDALHRSGLAHRDVRPGNVLITPHGRAVLVDLGVAHLHGGPDRPAEEPGGDPGTGAGVLRYRPPEQAGVVRRPVDHRCDLHALGAVLLQCLTGHPPVEGTDPAQVGRLLGRLQPLDPARLAPEVPRALADLLRRLLAVDPDDRPGSAADVAEELSRVAAELSPEIALGRRAWQDPADGPLLERTAQLALLDGAWESARRGSGGVLVVRGGAGSGRTALVEHLHRRARAQGAAAVVLETTTSPSSPLSALRRALAAGGSGAGGGAADGRPEALGEELLRHAARTGPLLVVLDDVEHADASTLAVLRSVARECADLPVLVVLVDRPDRAGPTLLGGRAEEGHRAARTLVVDVPALSDAAARAVLRRRLPGAVVPDAVAAALTSRAAGNPGALAALLGALLDEGGLLPDWGRWRLEEAVLEAVPVAPDLLAALLRRVDELPPAQRAVLRLAAACGRAVDDALVVRAAAPRSGAQDVRDALAAGVAARLLRPRSPGRHEFLHQQVVDAVLDAVPAAERRGLHARLARVLRVDALAGHAGGEREAVVASARQHLLAGDAAAPADVVHACGLAGVEAARRYAPDSAVELLERAAGTADGAGLALDPRLRRVLASCLARTGRHDRAHEHLERLLAGTVDPLERAVVLGEVATLHRHERSADGPARAAAAASAGLAELARPRPRGAAGWARFALATVLLLVTTALGPAGRRASRHRLDSPRETAESTLEAATAVLLREAAAADLARGRGAVAVPTALACCAHALRARRPDLLDDGRRTLAAAARLLLRSRRTVLTARLPAAAGVVGRPPRRARHARGDEDPGTTAAAALSRGLRRLHDGGTWREVAGVLEEHGPWLDLPAHVAGSTEVAAERLAAGHDATARAWCERAVRRVPDGVDPPPSLQLLRAALLVTRGRPDEAGEVLAAVQRELPPEATTRYRLAAATAGLFGLVHEQDTSERCAAACRTVTDLVRRQPRHAGEEALWAALLVVRARLARHRAAVAAGGAGAVRDREVQLREALRLLRGRRGSALQEAASLTTRAAAELGLGRPRRAERWLRRAEARAATLDAPLLTHHALLLRAELLDARAAHADAERQRWMATALAEEHGWTAAPARGHREPAPARPTAGGRGPWTPARGRRRRLLAAVRDVGDAAQVLDPQDLARLALDQACEVLGADRATLAVLDAAGDLVVFAGRTRAGTDLSPAEPLDAALTRAASTGRPVVRDAPDHDEHDPLERGTGAGWSGAPARSLVAVPLLVRGRRTGALAVASTVAPDAFGRGDVELLQLIAGQVAASLETARAARLEIEVHGAQRERDLAEAVRRVTEEVSGSLDLATVRRRLLLAAVAELGARCGALVPVSVSSTTGTGTDAPALLAAGGEQEVREVAWGPQWREEPGCAPLLERSTALHGRAPLPARLAGLLAGAEGGAPSATQAGPAPEEHWLVVPLTDRTGRVAEALVLQGAPEGPAARVLVAQALAGPAAIGLENARLFARVEHLARTDSLTGLATRGHLVRLGEARVRRAGPDRAVAAIMVDVDHFKAVNDRYGHAAGDEVLIAVARRLRQGARESDVLGRYGGEEFALVVTSPGPGDAPEALDAAQVAERLRTAVNGSPVQVGGEQLRVTVSIGVAELRAGERLPDVLARADTALYRAKAAGRDRVVVAG